jgi:hypothetical protein
MEADLCGLASSQAVEGVRGEVRRALFEQLPLCDGVSFEQAAGVVRRAVHLEIMASRVAWMKVREELEGGAA